MAHMTKAVVQKTLVIEAKSKLLFSLTSVGFAIPNSEVIPLISVETIPLEIREIATADVMNAQYFPGS